MPDLSKTIFVDESGDTGLPRDNEASIYTIAAVSIEQDRLNEYKKRSKEIVKKFAGSGELKSSSIGNKQGRRKKVLKAIAKASFPFYCLVIDKQRIWRDSGLRFKPVFYKFLHRMFYNRIKKSLININVISDPFGHTDFMAGFVNYIRTKSNLFESIEFIPSSEEDLLQITDVLAGSIRRVYLNKDTKENLKILKYPSIPIEEWPPNKIRFSGFYDNSKETKYDRIIRRIALCAARDFFHENISKKNQELRSLAEAVRFLLYKYHIDPTKYVFKKEIIKHLKNLELPSNERVILSRIRDHGLIISSTEDGVKIPYNSKDIQMWIERVNSQVVPYLERLKRARNDILIATQSEYDIVKEENFPDLLNYIKKSIDK